MEHCSMFKGAEPEKAQPEESDPSLFVIKDILASRLPSKMKSSDPKARLEKRVWLTKFSENKQDSVWLRWKDFVDDDNVVAQQLVIFEQNRTGLTGTLDASWEYNPDKPSEVSLRRDGFRTYTTVEGDTPEGIAKKLGVLVLDLLEQNVMRFAVGVPFLRNSKLKKISVLRLPKRTSVSRSGDKPLVGKRRLDPTSGRQPRRSRNKHTSKRFVCRFF
jgi:hypothetical protein